MIAIRTAVSTTIGIGHLVRMIFLAGELEKNGQKITFILDYPQKHVNHFLLNFKIIYLSEQKHELTEKEDALKTHRKVQKLPISLVILDSYQLGMQWETSMQNFGYKLAVFDDTLRKHQCDFIIDQKYTRQTTNSRYDLLVPSTCQKLLGPQYTILNPLYQSATQNEAAVNDIANKPSHDATLLFSLGGGGDLSLFYNILKALSVSNFNLQVVIGPLATNTKKIRDLASTHTSVQLIENTSSLLSFYQQADLFIGAIGTSFYECRALKLPAITFSLSKNQVNSTIELNYLEDYGHYFHLSLDEIKQTPSMVKLINTLINQLQQIKLLSMNSLIKVDGLGAKRIASVLLKQRHKENFTSCNKEFIKNEYQQLSQSISIRAVRDSDINHYLISRNLKKNRQNMTVETTISRLEHYYWWFTNKRQSYLLEKDGEKKLYIWHQAIEINNTHYLIGGWFVCHEETSFDVAAIALDWQLKHTQITNPNTTWIAIIKKKNKYVNLLNQYMGFKAVEEQSNEATAIRECFNHPLFADYNYVKYTALLK